MQNHKAVQQSDSQAVRVYIDSLGHDQRGAGEDGCRLAKMAEVSLRGEADIHNYHILIIFQSLKSQNDNI